MIVDTEAPAVILLSHEHNRGSPRATRRLNDISGKHLVDFLLYDLALRRGDTVGPSVDRAGVASVYLMFHNGRLTQWLVIEIENVPVRGEKAMKCVHMVGRKVRSHHFCERF